MIEFTPISQYIWVEATEEAPKEKQTEGGLFIPTTQKDVLQTTGKIVGIGILVDEKVERVLKVGDTILFEGTTSKPVEVNGKQYKLIIDRNVMAKL